MERKSSKTGVINKKKKQENKQSSDKKTNNKKTVNEKKNNKGGIRIGQDENDGSWHCKTCTFKNGIEIDICNMCGDKKN